MQHIAPSARMQHDAWCIIDYHSQPIVASINLVHIPKERL